MAPALLAFTARIFTFALPRIPAMRASDPGALSQEIVSCLTLGTGESSARWICAILPEPSVEDNKPRSSVVGQFDRRIENATMNAISMRLQRRQASDQQPPF